VVARLLEHPLAARFEFTTPQGLLRRVAPQLAAALPQRDQPPQLRASATAARNGLRL
jgi:hypothetical protein